MEEMIKRAHKMEDIRDYQLLSLFSNVRLPLKFKMPVLDKFDGTGCPISHLKMYMRAMQPLGATEEMLAQMFQNTLTGPLSDGSSMLKTIELETGKTFVGSFTTSTSVI